MLGKVPKHCWVGVPVAKTVPIEAPGATRSKLVSQVPATQHLG